MTTTKDWARPAKIGSGHSLRDFVTTSETTLMISYELGWEQENSRLLSAVSLDSGCVGIFSFLWRQAIRFVTYDLVISLCFSVTLPEFTAGCFTLSEFCFGGSFVSSFV